MWKSIPGWPGYEVSDVGQIRATFEGARGRWKVGRILKPTTTKKGYLHLVLRRDGKQTGALIHRLVAMAFIGESLLPINHRDGVKINNKIENLEYVTPSENSKHAFDFGLNVPPDTKGSKNGRAIFNENQIEMIRSRLTAGELSSSLAEEFGVCRSTISHIKNKRTWKCTSSIQMHR